MASTAAAKKIWFITGASSGLGLNMALSALRAGHRVIGTGRNIEKASSEHPEFATLGGEWLQLDVAQPNAEQAIQQLVAKEEQKLGKDKDSAHWVVVNNAGNTLLGAVEDMSEGQMQEYLQTNLFGFIRVWKALLPTLRRNRTGTLISISSIWGFVPKSEHMLYGAAKATTEYLTESYATLLAPSGIRTMIIEPGGFRTPFAGNNSKADGGISEDYKPLIQAWVDIVNAASKDPTLVNGDPIKFGDRVVDAVEGRGLFDSIWAEQDRTKALRVQLGSDSYSLFEQRLSDLQKGFVRMAEVAKSTDV
ncbi:NAD(P)-binding protein [Trichoderma citrinoviride]|uniref:NAD(P)-binding protein n=1 Tax=Trichoderma citrinoviride TaxID=58853 RepID=A0A2T4B1B5_9HYPO|nr:NAD(P)-binding protein [Trichoderma citrinoviride]PTB63117.1 NAD(P)-binding protein [Trichoderma citrinoviride]